MTFIVEYLQAVEPDTLPAENGCVARVVEPSDDMGLPRVDVSGPTAEAVIAYVMKHWGNEDADWFQSWVVNRVHETTPWTPALAQRVHRSPEVTRTLTLTDWQSISEALVLLADLDEDEHTDGDNLRRLAAAVGAE